MKRFNQNSFFLLGILSIGFLFSGCTSETKKVTDATGGGGGGGQQVASLPNSAFYCLRAGKDTVERWLGKNGGNDKFSRIVMSYYWPDRTQNGFTLIAFGNEKNNNKKWDSDLDTLKMITTCQVLNITNQIVLGSNEIPRETIRRLWEEYSTDPGRYLKFTPIISQETLPTGVLCCKNNLVYQIDLILSTGMPPTQSYDPGYTNPSPPKEPSN